MDDIYKNTEEYNPNKKRKMLIVFDNRTGDLLSNKKVNPLVTELSIRCRKLNISLVFITQFYFAVPKNIRLNSTHYFIRKFQTNENFNKLHLIIHQILTLKTLWIFIKINSKTILFFSYWYYSFSDNPSRLRKNLLEIIEKVIMTNDDKSRNEKLQYDINKEAERISALSAGKIDKYEYLTGEEILPSDQRKVIQQAKFQKKTIEENGKKR